MKSSLSPPIATSSSTTSSSNKNNSNTHDIILTEKDPLLRHSHSNYSSSSCNSLRERRSSKNSSPVNTLPSSFTAPSNSSSLRYSNMNYPTPSSTGTTDSKGDSNRSFSQLPLHNTMEGSGGSGGNSPSQPTSRSFQQSNQPESDRHTTNDLQEYYNDRASALLSNSEMSAERRKSRGRGTRRTRQSKTTRPSPRETPLLIPVSPEVRAVRVAALTVFDPLTYTWVR